MLLLRKVQDMKQNYGLAELCVEFCSHIYHRNDKYTNMLVIRSKLSRGHKYFSRAHYNTNTSSELTEELVESTDYCTDLLAL